MPDDPAAAAAVARRLAGAGIGAGNPMVVVHVSAGNPFRRWPSASFVELVRRLASRDPKRRIILTSGPSDAAAAAAIARDARALLAADERPAIVECGEFDLAELRALVGRAALYIGGDSGPLHIAGTTSVPVVGLYGPTLPVRSQPFRSARFISAAAEVHGSAVPSLRSAAMRARRFSLPDRNLGGSRGGARRKRTRRTDAVTLSRERRGA